MLSFARPLSSTALILFMTLPGLALFYGGLVRRKNVVSVLLQCFAITGVVTLIWTAFGYSLAFDTTGMAAGESGPHAFVGTFSKAFLRGVSADSVTGTIPEVLFSATALGGSMENLDIPRQLGVQILGGLFTVVYTAIVSVAILKVVDLVVGLRVPEHEEVEGLDLTQHGEVGYHDI